MPSGGVHPITLLGGRSAPPDRSQALAGALQLAETAAEALARIPDTQELRDGDATLLVHDHTGVEHMFETRLWHLMRQHRDGRSPDPATASPAELLAAHAADAGTLPSDSPPQVGESPGGVGGVLG
jgi:hypothetical protein